MTNPKVDFYFKKAGKWQDEVNHLRTILLDNNLQEELKWGVPCYTLNDKNIALIHTFKAYCAVLFHQGALLKDDRNRLIQQTKNVQAARQMRFTSLDEIIELESEINGFIKEAIANELAGKKVELKKTDAYAVPTELQDQFNSDPAFEKAFKSLTPGRQRGYLLYFSQAKQAQTRLNRIEKYYEAILNGKGLND